MNKISEALQYNGKTEYKGFTIDHFPCHWSLGDKEYETDGYVILSKAHISPGVFLPLYCEDENGDDVNFETLEQAKEWIDKYGNSFSAVVKHGDEIHAVVNTEFLE